MTGGAAHAAQQSVAAAAAEMERIEREAGELTRRLHRAQDEYIEALEGRDRGLVARLEKEIEQVEQQRDAFRAVSDRLRGEESARQTVSGQLVSITWASNFSSALSLEEVAVIGHRAATVNRVKGVTGVLVFSLSSAQFFQMLEGDADVIDKLYAAISADERHRDVLLLRRQVVDARRFPQWPMHTLNLADYDKPEQPLQAVVEMLAKYASVADACMQGVMRQTLVRGGNPLLLQPKRARVITLMATIHAHRAFTDSGCTPRALTDALSCFADTCARCVIHHHGIVIRAAGGMVHAQWQYTQLQHAKEAVLDIVAALAELRGISALSAERGAPLPDLPLCAAVWPAAALAAGSVIVSRQSTPTQVSLDVAGPCVNEATDLLAAALASGRQLVVSGLVAASLATAQQFHFDEIDPPEVPPGGAAPRCFVAGGLGDEPPPELPAAVTRLVDELCNAGAVDIHAESDAPPPLNAGDTPAAPAASERDGSRPRYREVDPDLLPTSRPAFAAGDVSRALLSDEELRAQFDVLDANKNGFVSKAEFKDFFEQFDAMGIYDMYDKVDEVLTQYNMLGDDKLSYDEFAILMLKLAQN